MQLHANLSRCWSTRSSASSGRNTCSTASKSARAGLEDHFCGKLMGVPMGVDVCYTNHAEADPDDADTLLALLVASGVNFVMGVPGSDDVMLGYQSTSFHDALAMRDLLGRRPAPEFETWLERQGFMDAENRIRRATCQPAFARCFRLEHDKRPRCRRPFRSQVATGADDGLWVDLRRLTPARIGLKRSGASLRPSRCSTCSSPMPAHAMRYMSRSTSRA